MFFKSKPNLQPNEKAQVEFWWQRITDCVGQQRMRLPILNTASLLTDLTVNEFVLKIGEHLRHDVSGLNVTVTPQPLDKQGGGG